MKKNLLRIMFVFSFLFIGASFARAGAPASSGNTVKSSNLSRVNAIKSRIGAIMKKKCAASASDCSQELTWLMNADDAWTTCVVFRPWSGCFGEEAALVFSGDRYNHCVDPANYPLMSKNTIIPNRRKRTINRPDNIG